MYVYLFIIYTSYSTNKLGTAHCPFSSGVLEFYVLSLSFFQPEFLQPRDSGMLTHKSQTKLLWALS